jgi:large subunit ribosomal protein L34
MLCIRCPRGLNAVSKLPIASRIAQVPTLNTAPKRCCYHSQTLDLQLIQCRMFTSFTPLRPTISPSTFRPTLTASKPSTAPTVAAETPIDLLPKISTHPALGATQIRCGPRDTFSPSHFVRKRRHGFLSRLRTRKGRNTLQRRRAKRRSTLSH